MKIVFLTHPAFFTSYSMPRYAKMLYDNMKQRGHDVQLWSPEAKLSSLKLPAQIIKWFKYVDQYVIFPRTLRKKLKHCADDTLFVFTDHALGIWMPAVINRPHVIHCHDFLAQRCAFGEVPGEEPGWTGKKYQQFIRNGYTQGKNFISVSQKTKQELHRFLISKPVLSDVVYNGLNPAFIKGNPATARVALGDALNINTSGGYLLHVGGNQWYKNRKGVIDMYDAWRKKSEANKLPLIMIGQPPATSLLDRYHQSTYKEDIHLLSGINDELVRTAYAGASVFLFPSLAEGFGWPIVEAMASGCLVITTDESPMTEVAGNAACLLAARPSDAAGAAAWAQKAGVEIDRLLNLPAEQKQKAIEAGLANAKRFDIKKSIEQIEKVYQNVLRQYENNNILGSPITDNHAHHHPTTARKELNKINI